MQLSSTNDECLPLIEKYLKVITIEKLKGVIFWVCNTQEALFSTQNIEKTVKNDDIILNSRCRKDHYFQRDNFSQH